MLDRFGLLSKKNLLPLFLTDSIKLDGMPTNIKLKIQVYLTLYFKISSSSVKSYKIQLWVRLFLVLHLFLYQQISSFCNFLELHSTLSEKDFCYKFPFLNGFIQISTPPTPPLPNSQNLLSVTKLFSQFSLKCLLK